MKQQTKDTTPSPSIPETGNGICKQCGKTYNLKEVARVYGKLSAVLAGGFCTPQCYTKYQTHPSIPVKDELNPVKAMNSLIDAMADKIVKDELLDITTGEWITDERNGNLYIECINKDGEETTAVEICKLHGNESVDKADAKAICTAVNNTYGKGYNPAAMEELYKALDICRNFIVYNIDRLPDSETVRLIGLKALNNAKTIKP